jgi:hypothetical protein
VGSRDVSPECGADGRLEEADEVTVFVLAFCRDSSKINRWASAEPRIGGPMGSIQCPHCANHFTLKRGLVRATCPKCTKSFLTVEADLAAMASVASAEPVKQAAATAESGQVAPVHPPAPPVKPLPAAGSAGSAGSADSAEEQAETRLPSWVSPYGAGAAVLAGLAFFSAAVLAQRLVTIGLLAAGLGVTVVGVRATREKRETRDVAWLVTGGGLCGLGLLLMLVAPAVLNPFWAMDFSVARADPDKQVQVRRDEPREQGRPLTPDDWTDAVKNAIRQNDVVIRVESVEAGPLLDKGDKSYLKIHLRLANVGYERYIPFEGFARDKHAPVLTDDSGHSYPFLEQRWRKRAPGTKGRATTVPVFEAGPARLVNVVPNRNVERLLIFEGAPGKALKLELPASAWGRAGVCKIRIPGLFQNPSW